MAKFSSYRNHGLHDASGASPIPQVQAHRRAGTPRRTPSRRSRSHPQPARTLAMGANRHPRTRRCRPPADLVLANLILHHFQDSGLGRIGGWLREADVIIAVEPLLARFPHVLACNQCLRATHSSTTARTGSHSTRTGAEQSKRTARIPATLDPNGWGRPFYYPLIP